MSLFSYVALPREFKKESGLRICDEFDGYWPNLRPVPVMPKFVFRNCFKNEFVYSFGAYLNYHEMHPTEASDDCSIRIDRSRLYQFLNNFLHHNEFCEIYTEFISGSYRKKYVLGPPKKYEVILLDEILLTQKLMIWEDLKVTINKSPAQR